MASGIDFLSSLNCVYAGSPAISSVAITKLRRRSLEHCFKLLGISVMFIFKYIFHRICKLFLNCCSPHGTKHRWHEVTGQGGRVLTEPRNTIIIISSSSSFHHHHHPYCRRQHHTSYLVYIVITSRPKGTACQLSVKCWREWEK